jgi:FKBP-type peptidyl-prolyl cis-trans isomerase FkpA
MKKTVLVLLTLPLLLAGSSCIKDNGCQDKTVESEVGAMDAYASANGITTIVHASGIRYQIMNPGTGTQPSITDKVSVRYTGKLVSNGTVFDSQTGTPVTFQVAGTVPGFQIALQLLKEGGVIKVIIPSSMGYGCGGSGPIPGNSVIFFEVELVDVI